RGRFDVVRWGPHTVLHVLPPRASRRFQNGGGNRISLRGAASLPRRRREPDPLPHAHEELLHALVRDRLGAGAAAHALLETAIELHRLPAVVTAGQMGLDLGAQGAVDLVVE